MPLFSSLSKKEIRQISQLATPLEQPAGTVLVQEGTIGPEFIIVLDGEIEIRKGDQVIATRGPGSSTSTPRPTRSIRNSGSR